MRLEDASATWVRALANIEMLYVVSEALRSWASLCACVRLILVLPSAFHVEMGDLFDVDFVTVAVVLAHPFGNLQAH